jgi:hypothetical protein
MMDRVDAYLEGELEASELTPAELRAVEQLEEAVREAAATLPELPRDFAPDVMQRIRTLTAAPSPGQGQAAQAGRGLGDRLGAVLGALWRPRSFELRLRPAYALAAVAVLAFAIPAARVVQASLDGRTAVVAADAANATAAAVPILVQFRLDAGAVREVALAGSFTEWQPTYQLVQSAPGIWTLVVPLAPGVHDYAFVVDGEEWVQDPVAPLVEDGFGGMNSRLSLLPPGRGVS